MRVGKRSIALCILFSVFCWPAWAALSQEPKSVVAHANGNGSLKIGDEEFKITSVVIKLFEDGKAEINLISDITVFLSGTWLRADNSPKLINLKISGGATGGGVEASGELFLREERAIDRVSLQGQSKSTHKNITLNFKAAD